MLSEPDLTTVRAEIEKSRRDLLDLGLRNTLLNFRQLKARGLQIVEELPREVFRILASELKPMSFLSIETEGREELDRDEASKALAQPDDEGANGVAGRHVDNKLQTPYSPVALQRRLLQTAYAARISIEEQGLNVLYLALGMLEWYEADASGESHRAPLILVPVELFRSDVQSRFRLRYLGDTIRTNLSLQAKLRQEFGVELPELAEDEIDVESYFDQVGATVARQQRWRVDRTSIALGFFSFNKLLMFEDLDAANWPEESKPESHELLQTLLVDCGEDPDDGLDSTTALDDHVETRDLLQVVDADSSQTLAILEARRGRDLVIQGPPGTGKSQTITNLIAELMGRGKRVLFVAEKMAALEVVKRRLDEVGLGDACLELHSHRANKRLVLADLQRTLELKAPVVSQTDETRRTLEASRTRLNTYCRAVNQPIEPTRITPYRAYGHFLRLQERLAGSTGQGALDAIAPELASIRDLPWLQWSEQDVRHRLGLVSELQSHVGRMGLPTRHPFWGTRKKLYLPPSDRPVLAGAIGRVGTALERLLQATSIVANELGTAEPTTLGQSNLLLDMANRALDAPALDQVDIASSAWIALREVLQSVIEAGSRADALRRVREGSLIPEAWEQDVLRSRQALTIYGEKWWRLLASDYRAAKRQIAGLCTGEAPSSPVDLRQLAEDILEHQRASRVVQQHSSTVAPLFGAAWKGLQADWASLQKAADYLFGVHRDIGAAKLRSELLDYLGRRERRPLAPLADKLGRACRDASDVFSGLSQALDLDESKRFGPAGLEGTPLPDLQRSVSEMADEINRVQEMVSYNHLADQLVADGLGPAEALASSWPKAGDHLRSLAELSWYSQLIDKAHRDRPELAAFEGAAHDHHVEMFRQHDVLMLKHNRARLAMAHWERLKPLKSGAAGQVGDLKREFQKKRRHKPIRQLLGDSGSAIQAIKPVFMMSPLSIAAYVPPESVRFDIVIFDEASQVRPVDAFGAILRASQAVVVGDSKQLPPTSFFDKLSDTGDMEDEEVSLTGDLESILGLFCARGKRQRMLRWHYRSRHESLIAVSNREFYENGLRLFPSPDQERHQTGLVLRHLPDTAYERGVRKAYNRGEAWHVARAVMRHARATPDHTLGVAAFSQAQMQVILDELELARREDPTCESFFARYPAEPFFVKNLENVQGDERDVIFISIGYGRDQNGYVAMNFGPLNRDGGERRLNVLITRARLRCEVFTNLTADDIDLQRSNARGVAALKTFLQYAKTGVMETAAPTGHEPDSEFEAAVASAIRAHGIEIHEQVGSSGFYIDLAIPHPERKGRYLLGIECDGATYHSAQWARDRDRLRQEVLERLGWRVHRIWSTDWYRNPEREVRRVLEARERALALGPAPSPTTPAPVLASAAPIERLDSEFGALLGAQSAGPYRMAELNIVSTGDFHLAPQEMLIESVVTVVSVEGPVHFDEVAGRIASAAGSRVGSRVRDAILQAARKASRRGLVELRGQFLWPPGASTTGVRDRSALPQASRKIELIPPEEIKAAALQVVGECHGIETGELVAAVSRLLGFARVTDGMRQHVDRLVQELFEVGALSLQMGQALLGEVH
jgi:very-short-patch-repair endonuclease/DNA polymerase III delta prime subunit